MGNIATAFAQYDITFGWENIGYDISGYIDCASDVQKYLKNALSVSIFAGTDVNFQKVGVVRGTFFQKSVDRGIDRNADDFRFFALHFVVETRTNQLRNDVSLPAKRVFGVLTQ